MDMYVAELDETGKIAAVWVKKDGARGPGLFDPRKHSFDPRTPHHVSGAPRDEIAKWIAGRLKA